MFYVVSEYIRTKIFKAHSKNTDTLDKAIMFCSGGILENLSFVKTILLHSIKIQIKNMHVSNYSLRK